MRATAATVARLLAQPNFHPKTEVWLRTNQDQWIKICRRHYIKAGHMLTYGDAVKVTTMIVAGNIGQASKYALSHNKKKK